MVRVTYHSLFITQGQVKKSCTQRWATGRIGKRDGRRTESQVEKTPVPLNDVTLIRRTSTHHASSEDFITVLREK